MSLAPVDAELVEARPWWQRGSAEIFVHTVDDHTFRGVLVDARPDGLLLGAPTFMGPDGHTELAGNAWIHQSRVAFVQIPPEPKETS